MKTGILGGTFDPPHMGHLIIAEHVCEALGLDRIMFVPASVPPHKQQRHDIAPAEHRLNMLLLAVEGNARFEVSDMEVRRGGISFTVDTLRDMKLRYPTHRHFLLVGMDNLNEFGTWKEPEMILRMAQVVVMTRPGSVPGAGGSQYIEKMTICEVPEIGIASREIRQRVAEGKSIRYLVPDAVLKYIAEQKLYSGNGESKP